MSTYIGNQPAGAKDYVTDTPIGSIVAWAKATLPLGWIECNGQSTAPYPDLATIVGANVPDMRGEFIRGYDNGRGLDVGRILGSAQLDVIKNHTHQLRYGSISSANLASTNVRPADGFIGVSNNGSPVQDNDGGSSVETRPRNLALIYIIRAFDVIKENGAVNHYIGKNYIINSDMFYNERGSSQTSGGYPVDRFVQGGGAAIRTVDAVTKKTSLRFWRNGVSSLYQGVGQRVEAPVEMAGNVVTFSFDIKWAVPSDESYIDLRWKAGGASFNTAGQGGIGDLTKIGEWQRVSFTGVTGLDGVTDFTHLQCNIIANVATATKEFDFEVTNVKLELGSVATPYEYPTPANELIKCQRYWQRGDSILFGYGAVTSGVIYYDHIIFPTAMQAINTNPTVIVVGTSGSGFGQPTVNSPQGGGRGVNISNTANGTVSGGYYFMNFTADAELL